MNKIRRGWFHGRVISNVLIIIIAILGGAAVFSGCEGKKKKKTAVLQLQITSSGKQQASSPVTIENWFIFSKQVEIKGLKDGEETLNISDSRTDQLIPGKKLSYNIPAGTYDFINVYLMTPEESEIGDSTTPSIFITGKIKTNPNSPVTKTFMVSIFLSRIIKFEEGDNRFKDLESKRTYIAILDLNIAKWLNSIPASVWIDAANRQHGDTLHINDGSHETLYNLIVSNIGKGAIITIKEAP